MNPLIPEPLHSFRFEWLPKYAPELNDIENSWRDLKANFLAHQARSAPRPSI